jgi:cytoskeletal protein RodZ
MVAGSFSKETVGEYLKRERESRRVTLEEISRSTRINRPYLEALERNDFRFFPRPDYIQGFLRGYARHIGLDPGEVLKRYEFQQDLARLKGNFHQLPLFSTPGEAAQAEEANRLESPQASSRKGRFSISRSILIQVILLLAALSVSFYLYLAIKKLDSGSQSSSSVQGISSSQSAKK